MMMTFISSKSMTKFLLNILIYQYIFPMINGLLTFHKRFLKPDNMINCIKIQFDKQGKGKKQKKIVFFMITSYLYQLDRTQTT